MPSSFSPDGLDGPSGAMSSESEDKAGSLSLSPDLSNSLQDRTMTQDGNPPKKRGPKPNSKPALTRRQELNRQAQRTHRERKELYIKALEDEVLRLKEVFGNVSNDKEKLADENRKLKDMLAKNAALRQGSPGLAGSSSSQYSTSSAAYNSSFQSHSGPQSIASSYTAPSHTHVHLTSSHPVQCGIPPRISGQGDVDFDQAGIDFVLTLERPCMEHIPMLLERAAELESPPIGHALMATCPPGLYHESGGHAHASGGGTSTGWMREPSKAHLSTLLDLSKKLNLDGEVTPVMAWGIFMAHPRFHELGLQHFGRLTEDLVRKVRCYGFGAVLEEFEVRDALNSIFN